MAQDVLTARPVILSKHKVNVISHGRPLSPIGSVRSISPYVRQTIRGSMAAKPPGAASTLKSYLSASTSSFGDYQKMAQQNLISINNNLSAMLQETSSGIDSICQKVRMCLLDASDTPNNLPDPIPSKLSTCKEESDSENAEKNEESVAELVEEPIETREVEQKAPRKMRGFAPFFTVLNPKTRSAESVSIIRSMTSQLGLARKCTAENFQRTMKKVERLSNYESFLATMVDDVHKEIETCYKNFRGSKKIKRPTSSPLERKVPQKLVSTPNEENRLKEIKKIQKDFTEDHLSMDNLTGKDSAGKIHRDNSFTKPPGKMIFSSSDVYRKKAITDLHGRLLAQVEANDSLIFFQKLMRKNWKNLEKPRTQPKDDDRRSEAGRTPLQYLLTDKPKGERKQFNSRRKYHDSLWFKQKKHDDCQLKRDKKQGKKSSNSMRKCLPQTYSDKSRVSLGGRRKSGKVASKKLEKETPPKFKVTVTNNQPLSEPERHKMTWMRAKYNQLNRRKLKYLDILDDITKNDLIPLQPEYPRRDEVQKVSKVQDSYLYKMLYGKGRENDKAWSVLFEPSTKCSREDCDKCKEKVAEDQKVESNERGDVIRTLSKYIFSENTAVRNSAFTVMPVHVYYDNVRLGASSRRSHEASAQKLPLLPMKETKDFVRRAEWVNEKKSKPVKIIYDPIVRKIDKQIRMASARHQSSSAATKLNATNSWSPKHFNQFCTAQRPVPAKNTSKPQQPPLAEIFKRTKNVPERSTNRAWNLEKAASKDHNRALLEVEVKRRIQRELEEQTSKLKSDQERKMWENKYGKTVGQKLISFVEKQPEAYQAPVPKYAMPKRISGDVVSASKRQMAAAPVADSSGNGPGARLDKLRNFQGENVQSNIQRAVEVIETKMIDILSSAPATESIEAFGEMEKEITNVLSLMKSPTDKPKRSQRRLTEANEYDSEVTKISEELFRKLERILESEKSSAKNSSIWGKAGKDNNNAEEEPSRDSGMDRMCFSSTSGEEKFTITAISPRRPQKSPMVPPSGAQSKKSKHDGSEQGNSSERLEGPNRLNTLEVRDQKVAPVHDQVVNLVLISRGNEGSAGDQLRSTDEGAFDREEEAKTFSLGEGDSSGPPDTESAIDKLQEDDGISPLDGARDENARTTQRTMAARLKEMDDFGEELKHILSEESDECHAEQKNESDRTVTKEDVEVEASASLERERFYENVNKIISRVESVYNQLEVFEDEMQSESLPELIPKVTVFHERPDTPEIESDDFLTPFMQAVKSLKKPSPRGACSEKTSPALYRSPSYFNVLSFLDTLTDIRTEKPVEVRTSRIFHIAYVCHVPVTFRHSSIENLASRTAPEPKKKKSGCLKKPSIHSGMNDAASKSRQKVSFRLEKEEKATQVTACAMHGGSMFVCSADTSTYSSKKDEQVSACLDTQESKSVDKMSAADDESTYQSTLEFSDEISDQFQTPDQLKEDIGETQTKAVEEFEEGGVAKVKVFYDDYQTGKTQLEISGSYNENSMLQVKESLALKKRNSLEKLSRNRDHFRGGLQEAALLEPLKNLHQFVDTDLLKEAVEQRHKIRMRRRQNPNRKLDQVAIRPRGGNESFLKGIYVFVYLLMFTALNLEYKCVN